MPTFAEFFCGIGMANLGLGDGWKCAFANDIDPRRAAVYRSNFGGDHLRVCDLAALTPAHKQLLAQLACLRDRRLARHPGTKHGKRLPLV